MEDEHKRITHAWGRIYVDHPASYPKLSLAKVRRLRHQDFFTRLSRHIELNGSLILESGCGSGIYGFYLATIGNRVVAVDYQLQPLSNLTESKRQYEQKAGSPLAFSAVCADFKSLCFPDGTFSLVFNSGVIEHYSSSSDRQSILREMSRVTRIGGHVVVALPNKFHPMNAWWDWLVGKFSDFRSYEIPEHTISAEMIRNEMEAIGFEVVWVGGIDAYNSLSKYPQWLPLRVVSYLLRVLLPLPSGRLGNMFGTRMMAIGRKRS
jgi:ubiquinone/menaquinone biosynthesis C-methylase UbiE